MKNHKSYIGFMVNHPVAANILMLLFIIGGLVMMQSMRQEVFPHFSINSINISLSYPGASPQEIEEGIILVIEESLSGIEGIDTVHSIAKEGYATVRVDAKSNTDLQKLNNEIKNKIDKIITFPINAEKPNISLANNNDSDLSIVVYANQNTDESTLQGFTQEVRDYLFQKGNVDFSTLAGTRPLELSIEVSQENLRRYGLSLQNIANIIKNSSLDLAGGSIKTSSGNIAIRVKERRNFAHEFASITILSAVDGTQVLLSDIASIKDGYEDLETLTMFNGKKAMMIDIYTSNDQTPMEVSKNVRKSLDELRLYLPKAIKLKILGDDAVVYEARMYLLIKNAALGLILVLVLLSIFLEIRLAFWVMMGIPISFMGAFLILPLLGVSLNMVSLFAFIIALGIVVDDAVVIGEHIYHYRQEGYQPVDAAIKGAKEMASPITFSILTNIAAFMPIYFMPGTMGPIFKVIPLVVITVFIISLLESIFVLPAHLSSLEDKKEKGLLLYIHTKQQNFSHYFKHFINDFYGPFLDKILHNKAITITLALTLLIIISSYVASGKMGMSMFPKIEANFSKASIILPYNSTFADSKEVASKLIQAAQKVANKTGRSDELLEGIYAQIGEGGSNLVKVITFLSEPKTREDIISTAEFTKKWRVEFGEMVEVQSISFQSDTGNPGSGPAISIELSHINIHILEKASTELTQALSRYSKLKDINSGFLQGKNQYDFKITDIGLSLGLRPAEVARQVRNAFYGAEAIRQIRGRNEIKVMVRLPQNKRKNEHTLQTLILKTPNNKEVPFYEAVSVSKSKAFTEIKRRDARRVITLTADISPKSEATEILEDLQINELAKLQEKYPLLQLNFAGQQSEMSKSMESLKVSFILAMLVIYTMLAIPFKSYTQPLIVMIAIPFGIIGAVLGHLVMGYSLSVISLLGIVALAGIVVNDSLVLINQANELKDKNPTKDIHYIIHEAAIKRFRPILLTTITTFAGLMPMLFETSIQAKFLIPMAISLGFGIVFATFITLILVPVLYLSI